MFWKAYVKMALIQSVRRMLFSENSFSKTRCEFNYLKSKYYLVFSSPVCYNEVVAKV